jgi:hypothetical protein
MAFTFRAIATSTDSATCNKPTGTASGDLLVALMVLFDDATVTPPSGWTEHYTVNDSSYSGAVITLKVFSKVAGGSEGASYTWTGYAGAYVAVAIAAYSGATTPAYDESNFAESVANSTTLVAGTITTDLDGGLILYFMGAADGSFTWTSPGGVTERVDWASMAIAEEVQATAGASTSRTFTRSGSASTYWRGVVTTCFKDTGADASGQPFAKRHGGVPFQRLNMGVW